MTTHRFNHLLAACTGAGVSLALGGAAHAQIVLDPAVNVLAGTQPGGMTAGDFDGDGDMDLATTVEGPDRIQVLLNNATGTYTLGPSTLLGASSSPQDLMAGDLDGDGDTDLAVAVRDPQGAVQIRLNTGAASFTLGSTVLVGDRPRGLAIADMNGDGDLDLAVANRDSNTASVLTNNGAGVFTAATFAVGGEPRSAAFLDFDADGDLDLAVTNHDDRTVSVFTNSGGIMSAPITLSVGPFVRPDGVAAADLTGDGRADLAVAVSDQTLGINQAAIFVSTGAGFNGPFGYNTGGTNTSGIIAVDLDCDGMIDLVTTNQDSNNASALRNTGGGAFGAPTIVATGLNPEELVAADIDADGDADIATANRNSNNVSVIRNQATTCAPAGPVGDLDGNGSVGFADLTIMLNAWGACPPGPCAADLTGDGSVGFADLSVMLNNWG